jgi:hypothetical protein
MDMDIALVAVPSIASVNKCMLCRTSNPFNLKQGLFQRAPIIGVARMGSPKLEKVGPAGLLGRETVLQFWHGSRVAFHASRHYMLG